MTEIDIEANLAWVAVQEEDGGWVAACPPLRLTAEGNDREELESMIHEILDHWFRARLMEGDLHAVLSRFGWSMQGLIPVDPSQAKFHVPAMEISNVAPEDFARLAN